MHEMTRSYYLFGILMMALTGLAVSLFFNYRQSQLHKVIEQEKRILETRNLIYDRSVHLLRGLGNDTQEEKADYIHISMLVGTLPRMGELLKFAPEDIHSSSTAFNTHAKLLQPRGTNNKTELLVLTNSQESFGHTTTLLALYENRRLLDYAILDAPIFLEAKHNVWLSDVDDDGFDNVVLEIIGGRKRTGRSAKIYDLSDGTIALTDGD